MTIQNDLVHPASPEKRYKPVRIRGAYAARVDDLVCCQTSAGSMIVTLPSGVSAGACIAVGDDDDVAAVSPITVQSGATIDGILSITLGTNGGLEQFIFDGTMWRRIVSSSLIYAPRDIPVVLVERLKNQFGSPFGYYPIDANDQLVYRWQDTGSATCLNLGALGAAQNLTAALGVNINTRQGVGDGHFGKGMSAALASNVGYAWRGVNQHDASAWTAVSLSAWVTLNRYVGSAAQGRVFYKNYNPGAWVAPFADCCLQFDSVDGDLSFIIQNAIPQTVRPVASKQIHGIMLNRLTHICGTYSNTDRTARIYVNGEEVVSATGAPGFVMGLGTGQWAVGDTYSAAVENPGGIWHEIRVSDVQRSATWVRNVYRAGIGLR